MYIVIKNVKFNASGHLTIIFTNHIPNWFERVFLFQRPRSQQYIGKGTRWDTLPDCKPVRGKLLAELQAHEKQWKLARKLGAKI